MFTIKLTDSGYNDGGGGDSYVINILPIKTCFYPQINNQIWAFTFVYKAFTRDENFTDNDGIIYGHEA